MYKVSKPKNREKSFQMKTILNYMTKTIALVLILKANRNVNTLLSE